MTRHPRLRPAARLLPLLLVAALVPLSGCATLQRLLSGAVQEPELTFQRADIRSVSLSGLTLDLTWKVDNPNGFGLDLAGLDYRFEVEGNQLAAGHQDQGLSLPASGSGEITLPFEVRFGDLGNILSVLKQRSVSWGVAGDFAFATPVGDLKVPFSRSGTAPVPRLPQVRLGEVRVSDTSLSGARIEVDLGVTNPNDFALPLDRLGYTLRLSGVEVGDGALAVPDLKAGSDARVTLPVQVSFARAGRAVYDALRSGRVDLALDGLLGAGPVDVPVNLSGEVPLR